MDVSECALITLSWIGIPSASVCVRNLMCTLDRKHENILRTSLRVCIDYSMLNRYTFCWCKCKEGNVHTAAWNIPDSKVHGTNMGPTWVLLAPGGPHVGPINLASRDLEKWTHNLSCCMPIELLLIPLQGPRTHSTKPSWAYKAYNIFTKIWIAIET